MVAVLAVWINRQALNTDNVTSASSQILANQHVRDALSAYLVDELFRSVDVPRLLRGALPAPLQADAGQIAAELRQRAQREAPQLLAEPQVQTEFMRAVRQAHITFLRIAGGSGDVGSPQAVVVTLDLHQLVGQLVASLGIGGSWLPRCHSFRTGRGRRRHAPLGGESRSRCHPAVAGSSSCGPLSSRRCVTSYRRSRACRSRCR